MDPRIAANREMWDERVPRHVRSAFYDVDGFKAGKTHLHPIVEDEVGDVAGLDVLHLQCHFGQDSIDLARRGARVTGVDFAPQAIDAARSLAAELGVDATFVECDVYALPDVLDGEFDLVLTSLGALGWLPDLRRWAEIAASFIRPGGGLYVFEMHPFVMTLDSHAVELRVVDTYFRREHPWVEHGSVTYADPSPAPYPVTSYSWTYSLGELVSAVAAAGLRVEFLHEFAGHFYQQLACMVQRDDGAWVIPGAEDMPMLYSLKATKTAQS